MHPQSASDYVPSTLLTVWGRVQEAISKAKDTGLISHNVRKRSRFVRDFSAADVILSFPIEGTKARLGLDKYPHLQKWLDTIHARPAYKRAEERAGKLEMVE